MFDFGQSCACEACQSGNLRGSEDVQAASEENKMQTELVEKLRRAASGFSVSQSLQSSAEAQKWDGASVRGTNLL